MATWIWASKKIEKGIVSKCLEHGAKVSNVVEGLISVLKAIEEGRVNDVVSIFSKVFEAEREADEVKRSLIYDLSRATLLPLDRDYVIRLALRLDDVADYSKAAARRLLTSIRIGVNLDKEIISGLLNIASKLREAMTLINRAFKELAESPQKALSTADAIERIEEEVDDLRLPLLEYVLSRCDEMGPKWCTIVKEIIDELENSVDRCENVADIIRYIGISLS